MARGIKKNIEACQNLKEIKESHLKEADDISRRIAEAIDSAVEEEMTDLNLKISEFASQLSLSKSVPDDDNGPFNSQFCCEIEKVIWSSLKRYIQNQVTNY